MKLMTRTYARFQQNILCTDYQCKSSALFVYFLKRMMKLQSGNILLYTSRGLDISQTAGLLSMEIHTAGTAGLFFDAKPLETLSAI